ncbi:serine protease [Streptosporangium sp. NBC_01810]|uniref:serine protease n=1 Tax=Streptosporangium sp. NBC_01810 TaxID=2975951 RepID=UPI002DDA9FBC|nr:serine protease [Streptosporangium sp. NBC_01810]WSA26668.1 serine protease [Streptosporangium sp. NBC_01810]
MSPPTIQLEPLVSWPRAMTVGQEYLVTVDLRLARPGDEWPYREEEFAFSCMLDGGERIAVESVDDISVILHRFGGTYGPARFVVTARGDAGDHELRLSLSTQRGATVRTDTLPVRITALASGAEDRHVDFQAVPGKPWPGNRSGKEGTWVAAIHRGDDPAPVGAGVFVGENRVLTCAHGIPPGRRTADRLWVTFPRANGPTRRYGASVISGAGASGASGDLAVLLLAETPSPQVVAAPVRLDEVDDLVGRRWSAVGLPDDEGRSVIVKGVMDLAPAHGSVTLTTDPGHRLDPGLSGAAVWSPGYGAVIGMVTKVGGPGSGVAITMREVNALLPGQLPEARGRRIGGQGWKSRLTPQVRTGVVPEVRTGVVPEVRTGVVPDHDDGVPPRPDAGLLDSLLGDQAGQPAPARRERADVIFAIEMSGRDEAVLRRRRLTAATIEQLMARYPGEVNVAVIGYTYHDYNRRGDGRRPVVSGSWLEPAEDALASLASLESTSVSFPGAAPLEDALHHIERRLSPGDPGHPVVLLVLARQPPHPVRASRDAALPCPNRYDHRELTDRLADRGVRLMTVTDDAPGRTSPHLRRLGVDHSVELRRADPAALVDAMAIQHVAPARRAAPTRRITAEHGAVPEPGRRVRRVGLLGPAGSGKTTFLGALNMAVMRHDAGLSLLGADSAATDRLVALTDTLVRGRRFPPANITLDGTELTFRGKRLSRGFLGRRRETDFTLHLSVMTTSGGQREDMARWLAGCDDLVYLFDPLGESGWDDASGFFLGTLPQLGPHLDAAGRLPHRLAVCLTKFDDFKVLETAKRLRLLATDPEDPLGFPLVTDDDAKELFQQLCRISGATDMVPNAIARFFHEDRIRYFVTSSIGFYVSPRNEYFDMDDYQNLVPAESGPAGGQPVSGTGYNTEARIRGEVHPINVVKPFLWLAQP